MSLSYVKTGPIIDMELFELLRAIFGKNVINRTLGTRTNVIRFPKTKENPVKQEFDVKAASDNEALMNKITTTIEEEIPFIPKMNAAEKLIYTGNVRRLYDTLVQTGKIEPIQTAQILDYETGQIVGPQGIQQLKVEGGIPPGVDPNSPLGTIIQRTNLIKSQGKKMSEMLDEFWNKDQLPADQGPQLSNFLKEEPGWLGKEYQDKMNKQFALDILKKYPKEDAEQIFEFYNNERAFQKFQQQMKVHDQAVTPYSIMTPITREILRKFIEKGELKLSPGTEKGILTGDASGLRGRPVETFINYFGVENMEVLDAFVEKYFMPDMTIREIASKFIKDFPTFASKEFVKRSGGKLTPLTIPEKDMLTYAEKAAFLHGTDDEGIPLSKEMTDYYRSQIEATDPDITKHIMQYVKGGPEEVKQFIKNLPDNYNPPPFLKKILGIPEADTFADGGRVGFKNGGLNYLLGFPEGYETGGRVGFKNGGFAKMIDFLLKNKNRINEVFSVTADQITESSLVKLAQEAPERLKNMYYKFFAHINTTKGEAPKTNLPKVRDRVDAEQERFEEAVKDWELPVKDINEDVIKVPEPFAKKYTEEFLAHDQMFGRVSGDPKVDAEEIAQLVAEGRGKDYFNLPYKEQMDFYDKAYNYLTLHKRVQMATDEAKKLKDSGREFNADGGLNYLMGF